MNVDWTQLINWTVSGFLGLLFGVIGTYVTYRLDREKDELVRKAEREKLELEWKNEREKLEISWQQKIQELQIQTENQERQFMFARLHEKRAEVIERIYQPLIDIEQILLLPDIIDKDFPEHFLEVIDHIVEQQVYFERNRIYLSPNICDKLRELCHELDGMKGKLQEIGMNSWAQVTQEGARHDEWRIRELRIKSQELLMVVDRLRYEIEEEFRQLMDA